MSKTERIENWIIITVLIFTFSVIGGSLLGQNIVKESKLREIVREVNLNTDIKLSEEEVLNDNFMLDYISEIQSEKKRETLIEILSNNNDSLFQDKELARKCIRTGQRIIEDKTDENKGELIINYRMIINIIILSLIVSIVYTSAGFFMGVLTLLAIAIIILIITLY